VARDIKKPEVVFESDLKEYDGPIVIDVTPKEEPVEAVYIEAERKFEAIIPPNAAVPQAAPVTKLVTFAVWFQKRSANNPKLKLSYREAIEAHCKCIGINTHATEEEYDAALAHFGI